MSEKKELSWLAVEYNRQPVGGVVKVPRPSNITIFKRSLESDSLKDKVDFVASCRGNHCFIRRLTLNPMT
jgi:hypothetical protein